MTYANLTDVSTRLGRAISDAAEIAQVNAWLGDAQRKIERRITDLAALVTAETILEADVVQVTADAVIRKIRNPDGKVAEGADDYNYRLNADAAKGEIFITDDEWELLLPDSPEGAFTIRPRGMRNAYGEWSPPTYSVKP
jgi:hypothetical protein